MQPLLPPATPPGLPALPPTSDRTQLIETIELLIQRFGSNAIELKLVEAIARALRLDDKWDIEIQQLGFKCAIDLYDSGMINAPWGMKQTDPDNPENWPEYQALLHPCPNCNYPGFDEYCERCRFDRDDVL